MNDTAENNTAAEEMNLLGDFQVSLPLCSLRDCTYLCSLITQNIVHEKLNNIHLWRVISHSLFALQHIYFYEQLLLNPIQLQNIFFPSMPNDMRFEVRDVMGTGKWWECPNNHPYFIGECGAPSFQAKCIDCDSIVGGSYHNVIGGNRPIDNNLNDQTMENYCLKEEEFTELVPSVERKMNSFCVSWCRFLMHSFMLIGTICKKWDYKEIMHPISAKFAALSPWNRIEWLGNHLWMDWNKMKKFGGDITDEKLATLLCNCSENLGEHFSKQTNLNLQTKEERLLWEEHFISIVQPMTGN